MGGEIAVGFDPAVRLGQQCVQRGQIGHVRVHRRGEAGAEGGQAVFNVGEVGGGGVAGVAGGEGGFPSTQEGPQSRNVSGVAAGGLGDGQQGVTGVRQGSRGLDLGGGVLGEVGFQRGQPPAHGGGGGQILAVADEGVGDGVGVADRPVQCDGGGGVGVCWGWRAQLRPQGVAVRAGIGQGVGRGQHGRTFQRRQVDAFGFDRGEAGGVGLGGTLMRGFGVAEGLAGGVQSGFRRRGGGAEGRFAQLAIGDGAEGRSQGGLRLAQFAAGGVEARSGVAAGAQQRGEIGQRGEVALAGQRFQIFQRGGELAVRLGLAVLGGGCFEGQFRV